MDNSIELAAAAGVEDGETVTFLVNEDGDFVMDITSTLAQIEKEGSSLFIITTEEDAGVVPCSDELANTTVVIPAVNDEAMTAESSSTADSGSSNENNGSRRLPYILPKPASASDTPPIAVPRRKRPYTVSKKTPEKLPICVEPSVSEKSPSPTPLIAEPVIITPPAKKKLLKSTKESLITANLEAYLMPQTSIIPPAPGTNESEKYFCDKCPNGASGHKFSRFDALSKHYRTIHQIRLLKQATVLCKEEGCNYMSYKVNDLRQHLTAAHGRQFQFQALEFASMEEFEIWRAQEEKLTSSKYVCRSSRWIKLKTNNPDEKSLVYYYYPCQRSGRPQKASRSTTVDPTRKKKLGPPTLKMDAMCTASISVIHDRENDRVKCEYFSTHYGHEVGELPRQYLSRQEKDWIHQLLLRGWNPDEILRTLKSGTIPGTTDKMKKVVRQDIFNVSRSRGVRSLERRSEDDSQSVDLWIQDLQVKDSILVWDVVKDPFNLVVMNEHQVQLLKDHGRVIHVVDLPLILDRTYRLIVINACGSSTNAYMIAYAITDHRGPEALQTIFTAVQAKTGIFQPEFILSSDPSTVADAWTSETFEFPTLLLPPWMIEIDWNEGLSKSIEDDSKREAVQKCLDILRTESDPYKFSSFLQFFTGMLAADQSLLSFSSFFANSYAVFANHWPGFHQLPDCSSLQQLNGELELIVRRSRTVKRLDKCLFSLEFIANNQPFHPLTEFVNSTDEIASLRDKITGQLTALANAADHCSDLKTLRKLTLQMDEAQKSML